MNNKTVCHRIIRTQTVWNNANLSCSLSLSLQSLYRWVWLMLGLFVSDSFHRRIEEWINHTRATLNFHFILYFDKPIILSLNFFEVFVSLALSEWVCVCVGLTSHSFSHLHSEKITEVTGLFFVHCLLLTIKHLNWFNWPDRFLWTRACAHTPALTHSVNEHVVIVIILLFLLAFFIIFLTCYTNWCAVSHK